jgi:heptosyltransferase-2
MPTKHTSIGVAEEFAALLGDGPMGFRRFALADLRAAVDGVEISETFRPGDSSRPTIVLVPGGARNIARDDPLRRWPVASYAALAERLVASQFNVVLLGGADDGWVLGAFEGLGVHDLIGKLTLQQSLRLLRDAHAVVTHDTGPLHLAGLVRTPTVGLFGPTDPRRVLGERPNLEVIWGGAKLPCRPCYDGRDYAPCLRNVCMEEIHVDQVVAALRKVNPLLLSL